MRSILVTAVMEAGSTLTGVVTVIIVIGIVFAVVGLIALIKEFIR